MLDIRFMDGRVRKVTPQYYTTGEPFGACAMAELELRLDDLSEGLFLEISHHRTDGGKERASGELSKPSLQGDAALMLLEPADLESVLEVRWNGELVMVRVFGELVVLTRLSVLMAVHQPPSRDISLLASIGELAERIRRSMRPALPGRSTEAVRDWPSGSLAAEMGVSSALLEAAIEAFGEERWAADGGSGRAPSDGEGDSGDGFDFRLEREDVA